MSHPDETRGLAHLLDTGEKRVLSQLARRAWQFMKRNGATDEKEEEFRRRISLQACGRRISEATRGDWSDIAAAFCIILGQVVPALRHAERAGTSAKRIAEHKLTELLKEMGHDISYSEPLFKRMYKTTREQASAKQVWAIFYELGGSTGKRGTQRRKNWKARQPQGEAPAATRQPF